MSQNDAILLKKFKEILIISQEVKIVTVAEYLQISESQLFAKLVGWVDLGFRIKNDLIIVENLSVFTSALDQQFVEWGEKEAARIGKIEDIHLEPVHSTTPMIPIVPTYNDYYGVSLRKAECDVLEALELLVGEPILMIREIKDDSFGYKHKDRHVVGLSLYQRKLNSLPNNIGQLDSLEELNLYENHLISIPESIGGLKSLKKLWLFGNKLESLPASICSLSALRVLWLADNNLTDLPENFGRLKALINLNLGHNRILFLPKSFGSLENLIKLELSYNQITSLPVSIGALKSLKSFWITNNSLLTLPKSIGSLISLEELNLAKNNLTSLPEHITSLRRLTFLNIEKNRLSNFPNKIYDWIKYLKKKGYSVFK
jgi:Leucine rich repeat/Leucine Rich Repeat